MRELKFRAWDSLKLKMIVDFMKYSEDLMCDKLSNPWIEECLIKMQYTGLKDKNGEEIYEGDIVVILNKPTKIYYKNGGFRVDILSESSLIYLTENNAEIDIIGNIYENPELLNKK